MDLKAEFTKKLGPAPVWVWALGGGVLMWVVLHKKSAAPATNGGGQLVYAGSDFGSGGGGGGGDSGGNGGGAPPPPTPPAPQPPAGPVAPLLGGHPGGTGPFTVSGTTANGQTFFSTYATYDTPSGGAPTQSNPTPGMAGWTSQQWQNYAQGIANQWGISVAQTGILNGGGSNMPAVPQAQSNLPGSAGGLQSVAQSGNAPYNPGLVGTL